MFKLEFETGNTAFRDADDAIDVYGHEAQKILKEISRKLENGQHGGFVLDENGNAVGEWSYE